MRVLEKLRSTPKRVGALIAVAAAVVTVPAALLAWGPDRPTFTGKNPADYVIFNSITDNPDVGDERNFVRIKEDSSTTNYTDNVTMQPGKVYQVMVYYHNNAKDSLNASGKGIAKDTTLKMQIPGIVKAGVNAAFTGTISASNARYNPVYDEAYGKNATSSDVALRYVSNSAKFTSNGKINGQTLPDSLFTTGAKLGYDAQDGTVPGCNKYAGYVTFKVRVDQPNFTVKKEVSTDGKTWVKSANAQPGSTVSYRITYQNTGTTQQDKVTARDYLPTDVSYVAGSSLIANASSGGTYRSTVDGVTVGGGYNAGSYQPKGNFYFKFQAKLPTSDKLKCGTNTLKNVARVTTSGGYKEDDATVTVNKECKPEAKYTCDGLAVEKLTRTSFKFSTAYTVQNATFKGVTYVVRDASGNEVYRGPSATYTRNVAGKYTVQAYVTVSVDGTDKTVTDDTKCKKPFEVTPEVKKIQVCELSTKKIITINESDFDSSKHSKNLDDCKEVVKYIKVCELATKKIVTIKESDFDAKKHSKNLDDCKEVVKNIKVCELATKKIITIDEKNFDATKHSKNLDDCKETPKMIKVCDLDTKKIVTIDEKDFDAKKHSLDLKDCEEKPVTKKITVCEIATGKIITIDEDMFNAKKHTNKDSEVCNPTPEVPELPETGAVDVVAKLAGVVSLAGASAYYIASRRNG